MKISFCIPLYNKAFKIEEVVVSIVNVCEKYNVDYEVKISNNASTDITPEELENKLSRYRNVYIFHLPSTISAPENWYFALSLGDGDILNLHLADDPMYDFDLNKLIEKFKDDEVDYVVGKTVPSFEALPPNSHFDEVNNFRQLITKDLSIEQKVKIIEKYDEIYKALDNPFGDINALFMRKSCIDILKQNIKYYHPVFRTFPDVEIYLKLFITKRGEYLDEFVSIYSYNKSSPGVVAMNYKDFKQKTFNFMGRMFIFEFINDPFYRDIVCRLSFKTGLKITWILFRKMLIGWIKLLFFKTYCP